MHSTVIDAQLCGIIEVQALTTSRSCPVEKGSRSKVDFMCLQRLRRKGVDFGSVRQLIQLGVEPKALQTLIASLEFECLSVNIVRTLGYSCPPQLGSISLSIAVCPPLFFLLKLLFQRFDTCI
jgi:hypothetical protein